jgi:hypothetical protein
MAAKSDTKPEAKTNGQPKAVDVLIEVVETVLKYRRIDKPKLAVIAACANRASLLLRISDLDERIEVENATTVAMAKRHGLIS